MRRRKFVPIAVAASIGWAPPARAQQLTPPVIGFLQAGSPDPNADRLRGFRQGLKDTGYVEGTNVAIEYRWAEGQNDRLPVLATELVRRPVAVIAAFGSGAALAAKASTTTIPIVFNVGDDPVGLGLVTSLARPDGNLTGNNLFGSEVVAKGLELLREMVPIAGRVAVLVNPTYPTAEPTVRQVTATARTLGLQFDVLNASTSQEINAAFATLVQKRPDVLFVGPDPLFSSRRVQLVHLATLHKMPATYETREFPDAGGLMSYGTNFSDAWRQVGRYVGRILKGARPAELPVTRASKFELVINVEAARMLGLTVPPTLLARADEVIE